MRVARNSLPVWRLRREVAIGSLRRRARKLAPKIQPTGRWRVPTPPTSARGARRMMQRPSNRKTCTGEPSIGSYRNAIEDESAAMGFRVTCTPTLVQLFTWSAFTRR
jgi:hypothetical protein